MSAAARTISMDDIYDLGEDGAFQKFKEMRWPKTNGEPVCPACGCLDIYDVKTGRCFACSACGKQFSVTSGTIFAGRKLSFRTMMKAMYHIVNAPEGITAVHLSMELSVQPKTAWTLLHKFREAMASETEGLILTGEVEIDGMRATGFLRDKNYHGKGQKKPPKKPGEKKTHRKNPNERILVGLLQRGGRILLDVFKQESESVDFVKARISQDAIVISDGAKHYVDNLWKHFAVHEWVNHDLCYVNAEGVHTNGIESFWARVRYMIRGKHHHVSNKYLKLYAQHCAWLFNHRRQSNGESLYQLMKTALAQPVSKRFKAYWQRRHSHHPSTQH